MSGDEKCRPAAADVRPVDREFYHDRLQTFLPSKVIDVHVHLWRPAQALQTGSRRTAAWPDRVASSCSPDELAQMYRLMLPNKSVTPLVFGNPLSAEPLDSQNAYVAAEARRRNWPALALTRPEWPTDRFERKLIDGGFLGAKPYLTCAPAGLGASSIRIFDFLPPSHLEVLDRRGWIAILHIPRPKRLADPENLAQLLRIDSEYPRARVVVAHAGRAYCAENLGEAFAALSRTRKLLFDTSANTNEEVFRRLLDAVGPQRVLFGSDLPITRMRMRRICENGRYVNLVPRGLYGDVSDDQSMRELDGPDSQALSLFLYEELDAIRRATQAFGATATDAEDIFSGNALRLIGNPAEEAE